MIFIDVQLKNNKTFLFFFITIFKKSKTKTTFHTQISLRKYHNYLRRNRLGNLNSFGNHPLPKYFLTRTSDPIPRQGYGMLEFGIFKILFNKY